MSEVMNVGVMNVGQSSVALLLMISWYSRTCQAANYTLQLLMQVTKKAKIANH